MLIASGLVLALANSVVNALCDPMRKYLTRFMDPFTLVAARGLIQAPIFCLWALYDCNFQVPTLNPVFWSAVCISGCINVVTSYLYNRSIQIAAISATVPFLSFTPAFLVILGFLLLGEIPSMSGLTGVILAAVGGFWLQGSRFDKHISSEKLLEENKGAIYMTLVAFLWSISNVFDKIGVQNSSPAVYGAAIQVTVACISYVLSHMRFAKGEYVQLPMATKLKKLEKPWRMIFLAGCANVVAFHINLMATQRMEVSYVIAIKRAGCVWSALLGKLFFKEQNFRQKLPGISLMIMGVCCIVLGDSSRKEL